MEPVLNVGIIGCGVIAPVHIRGFNHCADVRIKWACDIDSEKTKHIADRFGIPCTTANFHDVLDDPDVDCISVCTNHCSHGPIVADSLDSGKHVLCEKPLASDKEGLRQMFDAYKRNPGLVFSGVFQHRFDNVYRYTKELVEQKVFGTILSVSLQMNCIRTDDYYNNDFWRGTWEYEGGSVLINQAIHFIDIVTWVVGKVVSVNGRWANRTHQNSIETEDTAVAAMEFESGAFGTLTATSSSNIGWEPTIVISGTKGTIELRNARLHRIECLDKDAEGEISTTFASFDKKIADRNGKKYYGPSHPSQIADFITAIREKKAPFIPATSAREAVDIVLAIYESHKKGAWITLPEINHDEFRTHIHKNILEAVSE